MKKNLINLRTFAFASLLLCAVFTSCKDVTHKLPYIIGKDGNCYLIPVKPFYIINKDGSDYLTTTYKFIDKNKNIFEFCEQSSNRSLNIGDTIK